MNRTAFLVDGRGTKWLDLRALCSSHLHIVGSGAQLTEVHYFSALATHLEVTSPDLTRRHRAFISCLQDSGVGVELARFKKKTLRCEHCGARLIRREEKETDVALAGRLVELFPHGTVAFSFQIAKEQYAKFQLADPYTLKDGRQVAKPDSW